MRYASRCVVVMAALLVGGTFSTRLQSSDPATAKSLPAEELVRLLGKSHNSKELQHFRKHVMKTAPAVQYLDGLPSDGEECRFRHSWFSQGIRLTFDHESKLDFISLYAGGKDNYKPYQGELPMKLSFTDTIESVLKKLGQPAETISGSTGGPGMGSWNCVLEYPDKGLSIRFTSPDLKDRTATIEMVNFGLPAKRK